MLFDAKEFEHYFSSTHLRKGLSLFEGAKVDLENRVAATEFKFTVDHQHLTLKKKGDKILHYTCSCAKKNLCEHLSAVMFYFQKDALGLSEKRNNIPTKKPVNKGESKALGTFLKDIDQSALIKFIEEYAEGHALFKQTVFAHFSSDREEEAFTFYRVAVKNLIASHAATDALHKKQLEEVHAALHELISKHSKSQANYRNLYYLRLAIHVELPIIFNSRITGDEADLVNWLEKNSLELDRYYFNDFSGIEKQSWIEASLAFLKSDLNLYTAVFSFILPRAISLLKEKDSANDMKKLLERKNMKLLRSGTGFNALEIVRLQLAIKEAELFKTPFPFKKYSNDPEFIIARADLYFFSGKTEKAFAWLNEHFAGIKSDFPTGFKSYSDYIISKAKEKVKPELELQYLEENFVYALHLVPKELDRYLELLPLKKQAKSITDLIAKIKKTSGNHEIDKTSTILLRAGRLSELVKELKKQKNRFNLVHKIAVQSLPHYNEELLSLYLQHLVAALLEANYSSYQQPLFMLAKKYLDKLPRAIANELAGQLLKHIEFVKPLYNFVLGYYPHALDLKKAIKK